MKSVVSYPERGSGGSNRYRGNCSPKLITDLIDHFKIDDICDYMAGSYTTAAAATEKGIPSHCYDLNHGFDLLTMDLPQQSEFTFWHPPYWDIIKYSDHMYSSKDIMEKYNIDSNKSDLSQAESWEDFVQKQNFCMMKLFANLDKGGRLAVLCGDIRKKGKLYSQPMSLVLPGTLESIVIKEQHNCWSDHRSYSGNFIPIVHEYLLIMKKEQLLFIPFSYRKESHIDIRDAKMASWRNILIETMQSIGREVELSELYLALEGHKKTTQNRHWKEKIRQTLLLHDCFIQVKRGVWRLNLRYAA